MELEGPVGEKIQKVSRMTSEQERGTSRRAS